MPTPPTTGQVVLDGIPLMLMPDSYTKSDSNQLTAKGLGGPLRLGERVNLGAFDTWRQQSWQGGIGRSFWKGDEVAKEMYYWGDAETREGTLTCNYHLVEAGPAHAADNADKLLQVRSKDENTASSLWYASYNDTTVKRVDTFGGTPVTTTLPNSDHVASLGRSFFGGMYALYVGSISGRLHLFGSGVNTISSQPTGDRAGTIHYIEGGYGKGDVLAAERSIWKATGQAKTPWSKIGVTDLDIFDGEYWNQRFYLIGNDRRSRSALYVTDLITVQLVHVWPSSFVAQRIVLHEGVLFITGYTGEEEDGKKRGQLWVYDGGSIKLAYQAPEHWVDQGPGGAANSFRPSSSFRGWLAFGHGYGGVFYYDPGRDAVHPGPTILNVVNDGINYISDMVVWNGRLVVANANEIHVHGDKPNNRRHKSSFLISSEYDAGLPGQDKQWMEMRVLLKEPLPSGSSVLVQVTADPVEGLLFPSGGGWTTVGTISTVGTRIGKFTLTSGMPDLRSKSLRYKLTLNPSSYSGTTNAKPVVQAVEVDYFVLDDVKWAWSFTVPGKRIDLGRADGGLYTLKPEELEAQLEAMRRNPAKTIVDFTDKDGTVYKVNVISYTKSVDFVGGQDPEGNSTEGFLFNLTLAEV